MASSIGLGEQKMPKIKENIDQMKEAYQLWGERIHTQKTILRELEAKYRRQAVSSRTISRWVKEFNSISSRESEQDNKYEWRSLSKYEIPWQDGKLANYLNSEYHHQTGTMATGRQVKWLWRAWHSSDGSNLTPRDDIKKFWTNLIKQADNEAEREQNNTFHYYFNLKRRTNEDNNES
tara:strand:+ start:649 stop:1182 length:534 start_codon:yes stop_codon:yes gene_type:complete